MTANQLKLIAIIAMTVDHLAWTLFDGYATEWYAVLMHIVGRLTAPIMWYFIAEGYHRTRSVKKYAARLFALAAVSHFAYAFCFGIDAGTSVFNQTSVAWSLAWGLVLLAVNDSERLKDYQKMIVTVLICVITFPSDWSCVATLAILFIGANRGDFKKQAIWMTVLSVGYAAVYFLCIDRLYGVIQLFTCLSLPLLAHYNGSRGKARWMGKFFYFYYPAHMALCGILRVALARPSGM